MDTSPQLSHIFQEMASTDPTKLPTPSSCTAGESSGESEAGIHLLSFPYSFNAIVADFCLVPIGTPTASVSKEVAAVQRLLKVSGLKYRYTIPILIPHRAPQQATKSAH